MRTKFVGERSGKLLRPICPKCKKVLSISKIETNKWVCRGMDRCNEVFDENQIIYPKEV